MLLSFCINIVIDTLALQVKIRSKGFRQILNTQIPAPNISHNGDFTFFVAPFNFIALNFRLCSRRKLIYDIINIYRHPFFRMFKTSVLALHNILH